MIIISPELWALAASLCRTCLSVCEEISHKCTLLVRGMCQRGEVLWRCLLADWSEVRKHLGQLREMCRKIPTQQCPMLCNILLRESWNMFLLIVVKLGVRRSVLKKLDEYSLFVSEVNIYKYQIIQKKVEIMKSRYVKFTLCSLLYSWNLHKITVSMYNRDVSVVDLLVMFVHVSVKN